MQGGDSSVRIELNCHSPRDALRRCLRLDRGSVALCALAVRIGLRIRLTRRRVAALSRMIVARASWRRRSEDDMSASEHPQRSELPLAVSNFLNQIGNPENRRQRKRDQDPKAESIPLKGEERHRHDNPLAH